MINGAHLDLLQRWANHDLRNAQRDPALDLKRGSVFWYEFREPRVEPGELRKIRPVIVMDRDPITRFAQKLDLHVIPISSTPIKTIDIPIAMPDGLKHGLVTHATTINSQRLLQFVKVLSAEEMRELCRNMKEQLKFNTDKGTRQSLDPGAVYTIPWHDDTTTRQVVVLTDSHVKYRGAPALTMPVNDLRAAENPGEILKPRPVSLERLKFDALDGKISLGGLKRNHAAMREIYGV